MSNKTNHFQPTINFANKAENLNTSISFIPKSPCRRLTGEFLKVRRKTQIFLRIFMSGRKNFI